MENPGDLKSQSAAKYGFLLAFLASYANGLLLNQKKKLLVTMHKARKKIKNKI